MTTRNPQVIALMGTIARIGDDGLDENPHSRDSGAWHVWRWGWHARDRKQEARTAAGRTGKENGAVTRETVSRDGATWSVGELEALALATGWIGDREIGAMLGRSQRAVITARARVKARTEAI